MTTDSIKRQQQQQQQQTKLEISAADCEYCVTINIYN